jgi:hypothetical protein
MINTVPMSESNLYRSRPTTAIKLILLILIILVAVYGALVSWRYATAVHQQITTTETMMRTLVGQLDTNVDTDQLKTIISDCPSSDQSLYDTNLNQLATISGTDLQLTARLFQACALSRPERRLIMADQLQSETATYAAYASLGAKVFWPLPVTHYPVDKWSALADLEVTRAQAVMDLVTIQGKIIDARVSGESPTGTTIGGFLGQAVVTKQTISKLNTQIKDQETALAGL